MIEQLEEYAKHLNASEEVFGWLRTTGKKALTKGFLGLMSHCVGSYSIKDDQQIYSYRDDKNMPHATFEVHKSNGEIIQIKGKGNGPIHPKYILPILAFLKTIGMNIRPSEMVNLGYYHIPNCHIDFINKHDGTSKQMVMLYGEAYAF